MAALGDTSQLTAANTNRDGTGTLVDLKTAGTNGSQVFRVDVIATGATTAGMIRLFLFDGTNNRLYWELPVGAVPSPSGTVQTWTGSLTPFPPIALKNGWKLKGATNAAETFNVFVNSADN